MRPSAVTPSTTEPVDSRLRLVVGLGDADRERQVLAALGGIKDITVVDRCLNADQVLDLVRQRQADAALVAFDLHRLTQGLLAQLRQTGAPLVVLTPDPEEEPWRSSGAVTLPLDPDEATLERALHAARRGEHPPPVVAEDEPIASVAPHDTSAHPTSPAVIALAGGHGSPGRTTVALNLAVALGAVAPTVLVDADLGNPSLAVHLDADPTRNLYMLAHAEPDTSREWDHALDQEVQPLAPRSPHAVVLCGLPKPELRTRLGPDFVEHLLAHLRRRYRYVILDVGADLYGADLALHRLALQSADLTLLVVAADLVGLHQGQRSLAHLTQTLGIGRERLAVVLNRHDRRHHHGRSEIEWALELPTAAVIPFDHHAVQRALDRQQPLLLAGRSRAGRAFLLLAERLHRGQIALPPETGRRRFPWRVPFPRRTPQPDLTENALEGGRHGHVPVLEQPLVPPRRELERGRARAARRGPRGGSPPAE